ncbi:unnamed protein product [Calypogeia fissa]
MLSRVALLQRGVAVMAGSAQESVKQQKKALRAVVKRKLRTFPLHLRQEEDNAIQAHILSADWFKQSRKLCAYLSCAALREVETSQIVTQILQQSDAERAKDLYVPRVVDREANMSMLYVSSLSDLIVNSMGIVEPDFTYPDGSPRKNVMESETPVDLVVMPGLAFDRTGRRLGRGGGYYDVFLERYLQLAKDKGWKAPLLVALAYSEQVMEDPVPVDETDIPVDALVLSTGVLPISGYGFKNLSKSSSPMNDSAQSPGAVSG